MSIKHLQFDDSATILYSSITGAYQNLLTLSDDSDLLFLYNTTNSALIFKIPSGTTTKEIRVPPGATLSIDARSNSKRLAKGIIQVKHAGVATTSGEVTAIAAR